MNKKYKLISLHNATTGRVHHVALTKEIKLEKFIQGAATRWANSLKKKYSLDKVHQIKYIAYIWAEGTNITELDALKYLLFDELECDIDTLKPYPAKGNTDESIRKYIQDNPSLHTKLKKSRYGNTYIVRLHKRNKKQERSRKARDDYYSALKRLLECNEILNYAQQISQLNEIIKQVDTGCRYQLSGFLRYTAQERILGWERECKKLKEDYLSFKEPWQAKEVSVPSISEDKELILTTRWALTLPDNTMLVARPSFREGWCFLDLYLDIDCIANPSRHSSTAYLPWDDKDTYWNFKRIYLSSKTKGKILTVGVKNFYYSTNSNYILQLSPAKEVKRNTNIPTKIKLPHTTKVINSFAKVLHKTLS